MKHLLNKTEQKMVEDLQQWEDGQWTAYLTPDYAFNFEAGAAFTEDTLAEITRQLKNAVTRA